MLKMLCVSLLLCLLLICAATAATPTCDSLREEDAKVRWLSLPLSRLVVNPNGLEPPKLPDGLAPCLRTDLAYYSGERAIKLPCFLAWQIVGQIKNESETWAPHCLQSSVECSNPALELKSTTFLRDDSTLTQVLHVRKGNPGTLNLLGHNDGVVKIDEKRNLITIATEHYLAQVTVSRPVQMTQTGDAASGVWAAAIPGVKEGDEIVVEVRFAPAGQKLPDSVSDLSPAKAHEALKARETEWNRLLAQVPQPLDFSLSRVDPKGTTPDSIRRMYYKAWAFVLSDTLPEMPENDYPYPQLACGKPSLWAEGHPKSRPSAQWESIIGMQFLAQADPETAWKSFEAMMTLVDENGIMGGEGLPSRHAQTAWILYTATGDAKRLNEAYPAIKRMLLWKISDPRWVFKGEVAENVKDFEFVVHALIDAEYAIRVTRVLNMPEEEKLWQGKIKELAANADKWFWDDKGSGPYEWYDANNGKRSAFHGPWNFQAVALPTGTLTAPHEKSILDLLKSMLMPNAPFAGTVLCKHPTYQFTMLGVWRHGLGNDAAVMAEALMREITLAGEFAECYSFTFPPHTEGVTPSLFGAMNMIDGTLWHNGLNICDGLPIIAHLPGAKGVANVRLKGGPISVKFGKGDEVELSGAGLADLAVPEGFTASDGPIWRGKLAVGKELALKAR